MEELVHDIVEEALAPDNSDPLHGAANLTDEDVLAMADYQLSESEQHQLSYLLGLNSEGRLTAEQHAELD